MLGTLIVEDFRIGTYRLNGIAELSTWENFDRH